MAEFFIKDEDLTGLNDKVVVLTGGSSGIGLATVKLLLSLGAHVVSGDIQPPTEEESSRFQFVKTNVTIWSDLVSLFKATKEKHGRIDYVFANAGIGPRADYLALQTDENGDPQEPSCEVLDINLKSVVNTGTLAVHYLKQQPEGGAIVLMGSSTGLQPLSAADYSTAKHGVLGWGRGLARLVDVAKLPIRVNTLMPSWTSTNILPQMSDLMKGISHEAQPGLVVARLVAYLMTDKSRNGEVVYVSDGKYTEIEKSVLWPAYAKHIKGDGPSDEEVFGRILAFAASAQ